MTDSARPSLNPLYPSPSLDAMPAESQFYPTMAATPQEPQVSETHTATAARTHQVTDSARPSLNHLYPSPSLDAMPAESKFYITMAAPPQEPQVSETHTATAAQTHQVDLQPLKKLIQSIFQNAAAASKGTGEYENLNGTISSIQSTAVMRQVLDDIRSISCEISCNLSAGNVDENTNVLLGRLKNYPWNAKVVVAMAAFAFRVVELSMLLRHRNTPIAESVNILKGHSSSTLDFSVKEIQDIFNAMMEVVNTNLLFLESEPTIPEHAQSKRDAMAFFPTATYNVLRIVLKVASILSKTQDNIELSLLAKEVSDINTLLQDKLKSCKAVVKPTPYMYRSGDIPKKEEIVTEHLFPKYGISELMDKMKKMMTIQVPENLRKRHVLFLVSDLDISDHEINVLNQLCQKKGQTYEIVWVPILDLLKYDKKRFGELKQRMTWAVLELPSIQQEDIEFIRKELHFLKNPIAVSVNPAGEVTCLNALPMLWIWGNSAFPFTDEKERDLWISNTEGRNVWSLKLLFDGIFDIMSSWEIDNSAKSTTFVCLFGGGDISWIREFTKKVSDAADSAGVVLQLVYVGKNKGKAIERTELSRDIKVIDPQHQWHFWTRLESILYSKIRHGKKTDDQVLQEAKKVLGYDCKGEAWAMFSMAEGAMVTTNRDVALSIEKWTKDKNGNNFLKGLKDYSERVMSRDVHGSIEVSLPVMGDQVPGTTLCTQCSKAMKMFYTYRCRAE